VTAAHRNLATAVALAAACGGSSSSPVPVSAAAQLVVLDAALDRVQALAAQGPGFDYPSVQAALLQDPAVQLVGTSATGALWVQAGGANGPVAVVAIDPTPGGVASAAMDGRSAARLAARAEAPRHAAAAATGPTLPKNTTYRAYFALGSGYTDPTADVGRILQTGGYTAEDSGPPTVEALRGVAGTGVFFIKTHGETLDSLNPQTGQNNPFYALYTATPYPDQVEDAIANSNGDWTHHRVTQFLALNKAGWSAPDSSERHYAITGDFVTTYMSFNQSVVFIDACQGGASSAFGTAFIGKGAALFLGWSANANAVASDNTARYVFDRLTGANDSAANPETIPQRPFNFGGLSADIAAKKLLTAGAATLVSQGDAVLSPSISYLTVDETAKTLTLHGIFGTTQDAVTVGPDTMAVTSWVADTIVTSLPSAGGDVVVSVGGRKSNTVQLTDWNNGTFTYQVQYDFGTGSVLQQTVNWAPHFRADVHDFRTQAGVAPIPRGRVAFQAAQDSQCSYANTGSVSPPSGTIMWSGSGSVPEGPSPDLAGSDCYVSGVFDTTQPQFPATVFAHVHNGLVVTLEGMSPAPQDVQVASNVYTTPPWGVTLARDGILFDVQPGTSTPVPIVIQSGATGTFTFAWTGLSASSPPDPKAAR
jgi:hypothetical protein